MMIHSARIEFDIESNLQEENRNLMMIPAKKKEKLMMGKLTRACMVDDLILR